VRSLQTRSLLRFGGAIWYCVDVQTVKSLQMRSEVSVGAVTWYWVAVHAVMGLQMRSCCLSPTWTSGCASQNPAAHGGVAAEHLRSEVSVGLTDAYSFGRHCEYIYVCICVCVCMYVCVVCVVCVCVCVLATACLGNTYDSGGHADAV
jgi:hypothetical protein